MQRKSRSDIRCEIADEAIKEENYDWHRSVDLAIKRYKAWGSHSSAELDDLIDIVRRKIEDEEKLQSKIKLEQYKNLRG
ncbi:hypothetical protein HGG82_00945 [Marinomonas sp. M1K-6]|uniref:Uncharacterized protein n=1 Tax=Marinomonas profundi TaxID=2726122 RepID=A0A847QUN3_9GAMM|nr:hypothetical protein [Marinomonas profundi]NLQ16188.1 hypothetical protein [Marinomonas profundi]UDV03230.1 hypothetical protein J8N69_00055 [Marinomonas profundi]